MYCQKISKIRNTVEFTRKTKISKRFPIFLPQKQKIIIQNHWSLVSSYIPKRFATMILTIVFNFLVFLLVSNTQNPKVLKGISWIKVPNKTWTFVLQTWMEYSMVERISYATSNNIGNFANVCKLNMSFEWCCM